MTRPPLSPAAVFLALTALALTAPARGQNTPDIQPSTDTANSMPKTGQGENNPVIRSVKFVGVRSLPHADVQKVVEQAALGKVGDRDTIAAAVRAVVTLYRSKKYTLAQVTEAAVTPDGELHLTVTEGTVRRILVQGNKRTRTRTILAALSLQPGDTYRADRAESDRQRLARLGIFEDVKVGAQIPNSEEEAGADKKPATTKPTEPPLPPGPVPYSQKPAPDTPGETASPGSGSPAGAGSPATPALVPPPPPATPLGPMEDAIGQVDVIVRVRETATANIAATVGYSDGVGAVGFVDFSEDNLLGTAHRISLQWQRTSQATLREDGSIEPGDSRMAFNVSYAVPPIGPRTLAYAVDVYNKNTVFLPIFSGGQDTIRTYERRRGLRGQVGRSLTGNVSVYLTARRDEVGYDLVPDNLNPPIDLIADSNGTVGALGFALIADGRDAADNPRRGFLHQIQVERAGSFFGGNRLFTTTSLDLRQYVPLLKGRARGKERDERRLPPIAAFRFLGGYAQGDTPLSEQFFLGGYELLRGYDLYSIYGTRMGLATAELRLPIAESLQAVLFTDCGNAWLPGVRASFSDLRASAGLGLRFLSPIGPIRIDAAVGDGLHTYLSLGQSF